jgi:hypothetical protein
MSDSCQENKEEHRGPFTVTSVACTKEEAANRILSTLVGMAQKERKTKCEDLSCGGGIKCQTGIPEHSWEDLKKKIEFTAIKRPKCPQEVGWLAVLSCNKDDKFTSVCKCVPIIGEEDLPK